MSSSGRTSHEHVGLHLHSHHRDLGDVAGSVLDRGRVVRVKYKTKLVAVVTTYDRKQATRRGYNVYALPQYLEAINEAVDQMDAGKAPRDALVSLLSGRLLDVCLKAIGEWSE
jgi:hypothetical protein